jgi:hypothetical protein
MFGLSEEHKKLASQKKCPLCGAEGGGLYRPLVPRYFREDGTRIDRLTHWLLMERSAIAECPKCLGRWNVFATNQTNSSSGKNEMVFEETDRFQEVIGEEERIINNSQSSGKVSRRFTVSKEWLKSYSIELENATKNGVKLEVGLLRTIKTRQAAEESLIERYSVTEDQKRVYQEEIILDIPARTKMRVIIIWKRIFQRGVLKITQADSSMIEIPFQVAIGLTFDQTQIDES